MSILHRTWSLLPRRLRREALFGVMALLAPRIARPMPDGVGPITHCGYFSSVSGLGMAARRLQHGLRLRGLGAAEVDLTGPLRQGAPASRAVAAKIAPGPGTLLVHVNGPILPWALKVLGRTAVAGKRVIAVWNWELPLLPDDWNRGFSCCHEIWAGSRFSAMAFQGHTPVRVVPYPVLPTDPSGSGRDSFGLPGEAFVALQVFDAASSIDRKNPAASIAAHHQAFGDDPNAILVLKVHNTARGGKAWLEIRELAASRPNVRILDGHMAERELYALMLACDVMISLHRAEGFGFTLAEALALGRPVIATAWSGNLDFMDAPGAHKVPVTLVPASDRQFTYQIPGATWAEPDVAAAARLLRKIAEDPSARRPLPFAFPPPDYFGLLGLR